MDEISIILRLVCALLLGSLIGVERVHAGKRAGVRTLGLVALGSALLVVISEAVFAKYGFVGDPLRVAASIITGIGFLGAGMIILKDDQLANLTTAAGVWVAAGIGIAVGFGMYFTAITVTALIIITFTYMWNFEHYLKKQFKQRKNVHENEEE